METSSESKTWQEIKLRKPSQQICDTMQSVINNFSEISASKALADFKPMVINIVHV